MPGHEKKGKPNEKDPDPEPYLVVTMEMKREDMQRPFDPRKSYWCPDGKGGFTECLILEKGDTESTVAIGHIVSTYNNAFYLFSLRHILNKFYINFHITTHIIFISRKKYSKRKTLAR